MDKTECRIGMLKMGERRNGRKNGRMLKRTDTTQCKHRPTISVNSVPRKETIIRSRQNVVQTQQKLATHKKRAILNRKHQNLLKSSRIVKQLKKTTKNKHNKMSPLQKREVTGQRQSPIDIQDTSIQSNQRAKRSVVAPLSVDYRPITGASGLTLENTGHGWKLNIPDSVAKLCPVTGGPLGTDQYRLLQIHSHWGCDDSCGSEHTVQGKSFPCEIHLVHWNVTKYDNPSEAMECTEDGLAVIGVFVEIGDKSMPLSKICDHLQQIKFKGDKTPFDSSKLDLNQFLPDRENLKFWNYEGSLTTPPFSESVIWIVLEKTIQASSEQIANFRTMNKNCAGEEVNELVANWRDVQPLHSRAIAYFD